ncbi:hypothetical protein [Aliikangiella sp. G2MR2-5]|uniref:hypothetical protein n=1 Tax=Aliikangiella sp. G2MR2-5 TaxID=2788943 RepID=UPI0018AB577C|nr:hypothetical protein [Aliikangiella sp. G2MR2-5]
MKTSFLKVAIIAFVLLAFNASVSAHGDTEPKHGGIVKIEHEMVFELVREEAGASIYLRDHGKPYSTEKLTGSLVVLANGKKSDSSLIAAGNNKMTAEVKIPDGAKVLVKVKEEGHHSVTVRFAF